MNKKTFLGICILSLILLASAVFALNVQYIDPETDSVLTQAEIDNITTSSLPSIPLTLKFTQDALTVTVPSLNITQFNPINLSLRHNLSIADLTNITNKIGNASYMYKVIDAYAFNILNSTGMNKTFTVEFNYLGLNVTNESDLVLFKADFDFSTNTTDFSSLQNLTAIVDTTNDKVNTTTANFSIFILAEDQYEAEICNDNIDNDFDGDIDSADSDCYVPPPPTPSGGGAAPTRRTIPTGPVFIVNCTNGLKDFGEKGIDCGPICGNVCPEELPEEIIPEEIEEEAPPIEEAPSIIPTELIAPVPEVRKPIDLGTLMLGIIFVIILIGGIAVYRHAHITEKVPMPGEKVPPVRPMAPKLKPKPKEQPSLLEEHFNVKDVVEGFKEKPHPKNLVSQDAMQKLVDYIHVEEDKHFTKDKIRKALLRKKWPENAINEAFGMLDSMKQSISSSSINKLHRYILKEFGKGFNEEQIKFQLTKKDWPGFIVNEAFNQLRQLENDLKDTDLHIVTKDIERARQGARALLNKGYKKKKLFNALLLAGWPSNIARKLLK